MGIAKQVMVGCALSLAACVGEVDSLAEQEVELAETGEALCGGGRNVEIDARRSLAVTDEPILAGFSFERVMNQLVSQARVPGLTPAKLFNQWWDTQNRGGENPTAPHCDSELDATLGSVINGFPYDCREAPSEGAQATCNPFTDAACKYIPVGLFNRFDLAPEDGSSCGEYRIVYAKESGIENGADRNLVIFEAAMPNPEPRRGLAGCRPIVSFWAELSRIDDMQTRARYLEQFYFRGLGRHIPAVVDIHHFGDNSRGYGQVRTNQFMGQTSPRVWTLREFKLEKSCERRRHGERSCKLEFVPVTDKGNPWGGLFAEDATHPRAQAFQAHFVDQVESLSADSLLDISMETPDEFNSAQSHASGSTDTNYLAQFVDGGEFASAIEERLDEGSTELEPVDIVARAQTQTCAGCHQLSNNDNLGGGLTWPASLGFVHVSEREPETVDGVRRFRISPALTGTFLPHRKDVMESFLRGRHQGRRPYRSFSH